MIYETDLECLCDRFYATVAIEYEVEPGEKATRYARDGSGYPGSLPTLDITKVTVTTLGGDNWDKSREALEAGGWAQQIDKAAEREVERLVSYGGWLYEHLFEFAWGQSEATNEA